MADARGFTLVEVLVAFTILALALQTCLGIFGSQGLQFQSAESRREAGELARELLAETRENLHLRPGRRQGDDPRGYRWTVDVSDMPEAPPGTNGPVRVYRVAASVTWGRTARPQSLTVETVRLAIGRATP